MAVTLDIVNGNTGKVTIHGWQDIDRIATVSGLTSVGHAMLDEAVLTAGVPRIGDVHPTVTVAYCYELIPVAVSNDTVRITIRYEQNDFLVSGLPGALTPQFNTVDVGATLSQVETSFDRHGNRISVSYTYPADYTEDPSKQEVTETTSKTVQRLFPDHQISVRKQEFVNPAAKALDYVGSVNDGPWSLAPSSVAGQWLCTGITGSSNDGRVTWTVLYTFQYRPDTWSHLVQYIDPRTGEPPSDLVENVGYKYIELYPIMNFNFLGL